MTNPQASKRAVRRKRWRGEGYPVKNPPFRKRKKKRESRGNSPRRRLSLEPSVTNVTATYVGTGVQAGGRGAPTPRAAVTTQFGYSCKKKRKLKGFNNYSRFLWLLILERTCREQLPTTSHRLIGLIRDNFQTPFAPEALLPLLPISL